MSKRVDANHVAIVKGLRNIGATVQSLADLGKGAPDIAVGWRGVNTFLEIKNPLMPPSKQRLTEAEEEWHCEWRGQVAIVTSLDEALRAIGAAK